MVYWISNRPASFAYVADTSSEEKELLNLLDLNQVFNWYSCRTFDWWFLILISKETPFYVFSILGIIASIGIYKNLENKSSLPSNNIKFHKKFHGHQIQYGHFYL